MLSLHINGAAATADAKFYSPLEKTEIVANGKVIASSNGAHVEAVLPASGPVWVAARTRASESIQAHTNPVYLRWDGKAPLPSARKALAERWQLEIDYFQTAPLAFPSDEERRLFFTRAGEAKKKL